MKINIDQALTVGRFLRLEGFAHRKIFEGVNYPWEVLSNIAGYCLEYIHANPQRNRQNVITVGQVHIADDVIIGEGTVIEHGVMIKGPAIIGRNCEIRKGAYFRGNVIIGDNCLVGNSSELKNCIVLDKAEICHFNYIGDSILGEGVFFAAGAITSNNKLDKTEVVLRGNIARLETCLKKFGAVVGDYCSVGVNSVLNPGTTLGRKCVIYPGTIVRGAVPAGHIVKLMQEQTFVLKQ